MESKIKKGVNELIYLTEVESQMYNRKKMYGYNHMGV